MLELSDIEMKENEERILVDWEPEKAKEYLDRFLFDYEEMQSSPAMF